MESAVRIVFIHGRDQAGKNHRVLQEEWNEALHTGLRAAGLAIPTDLETHLPFFGDRLEQMVEEIAGGTPKGVIDKGAAGPTDARLLAFQAEALYELAEAYGITDNEIALSYDGSAQEKGALNWPWVQAILRRLDQTPIGAEVVERVTKDVFVYLTYRRVQETIDRIVAESLSDGENVVVAHSLGSIVGYNVLRDAPQGCNVRRFVTLGSPLGVRAIRQKLRTPLSMPAVVSRWFNAFDPRDVVALNSLDSKHFPIDPPIINKPDVSNLTSNRHGITGYLSDPEVAKEIVGLG